ncbi:MAG: hypothetical protein ACOZAO_00785 [Patescibacteria group bacterium]
MQFNKLVYGLIVRWDSAMGQPKLKSAKANTALLSWPGGTQLYIENDQPSLLRLEDTGSLQVENSRNNQILLKKP